MDIVNLKHKINKYIKKGKFDIKLDVFDESEYTYQLLKHKYINNKMIGGTNEITLNDKLLYYVYLHGSLLPKEYVKVPDNLIVILPSCCGKSNLDSRYGTSRIIKEIRSSEDMHDISKPVTFVNKKHFIYTGGEEICNISLSYDSDYMILTNGIVFDMKNNNKNNKEDYGIVYFDENIMESKPLRTDDFIISKYIMEMLLDLIYIDDEFLKRLEYYEKTYDTDFYTKDSKELISYDMFYSSLYFYQKKIINLYVIKNQFNMIIFNKNIFKTDINLKDIYSTHYIKQFYNREIGRLSDYIFHNCLLSSINLCVYALYFCMYNEDIETIKETLKNMTTLNLINKKLIFNFILPTYFFKNKEIINKKIKNYFYNDSKFNLILSYINDNILSMCTPNDKQKKTIKEYYNNIETFIINNILYFYPFFVYYFHGYSDLSIDFLKMINEQDNKSITLKDVFQKFSELKSDKKIIVYINSCQGSVSDEEKCYLYKCIKTHMKKINEIDIDDKIFNIKNPAQLLADIYEKTIFFNIYFKLFFEIYLTQDEKYSRTPSFRTFIINFFKKIDDNEKRVDYTFIQYFDNFIRYIQNKYEIEYAIIHYFEENIRYVQNKSEIDYEIGQHYEQNEIYMILFSFYIIQIMYNICEIIINNKIEDYLANNSDKKDTFMYYILKKGLTIDKNEEDTFMYYALKKGLTLDKNFKEYFIKDIKHVYGMINNHIL